MTGRWLVSVGHLIPRKRVHLTIAALAARTARDFERCIVPPCTGRGRRAGPPQPPMGRPDGAGRQVRSGSSAGAQSVDPLRVLAREEIHRAPGIGDRPVAVRDPAAHDPRQRASQEPAAEEVELRQPPRI